MATLSGNIVLWRQTGYFGGAAEVKPLFPFGAQPGLASLLVCCATLVVILRGADAHALRPLAAAWVLFALTRALAAAGLSRARGCSACGSM